MVWIAGSRLRFAVLVAAIASIAGSVLLTGFIPPVVGLGEKVRLPIFHGASTWVNLGAFTLLGVAALFSLVSGRRELYGWTTGIRSVSAVMWLANTVLGGVAAMKTWDFTGSEEGFFVIAQQDPRLIVQAQLLLLAGALLIAVRLTESRKLKAVMDIAFVAVMWWLLGSALASPEARALHPDNPVMNSGPEIQLPFFAILAALSFGVFLLAWLVRDWAVRYSAKKL